MAISFYKLGILYYEQRDYVQALLPLQKSLEIRQCFLGENYLGVAESLNALASLYETQGDFISAILLSQQALEIIEKTVVIKSR